ncbi:MAG: VanW family protein [Oscillospiraceae bacterium]|jgi:vancomycin resistance protein VanW|nr:VanW family protein [Oscillospiraceae bacterium]
MMDSNRNAHNRVVEQPIHRSKLRAKLGRAYYGMLRRTLWVTMRRRFAKTKAGPLPCVEFCHRTPLLRKLKDVDMQYQYNKIQNLNIAAPKLDGIVLHPGEVFSYWRLIGRPGARRGYVPGMVLRNGLVTAGVGGGLCQMSNLIFWMTLHTPLTVVERHRHGYDVFPDSNRTQPFGSGATCFYPHGDLMIRNDTDRDYQLTVRVGEEFLFGEWRSSSPSGLQYKVVEKNHEMKSQYWGGYTRHNEIHRQCYDADGNFLNEEFVVGNSAIMMYSPFLSESTSQAAE